VFPPFGIHSSDEFAHKRVDPEIGAGAAADAFRQDALLLSQNAGTEYMLMPMRQSNTNKIRFFIAATKLLHFFHLCKF
jgi:hypothetical protein